MVEALDGCLVEPRDLAPCLSSLAAFSERYAMLFPQEAHEEHARTYIEGLLSSLHRKTIEPIATDHDQPRRPLQRFVGAGPFDDDVLMKELRTHVVEEVGDPGGVLILDPTCFQKKGDDSVGVARQWNGRLGKQDNCQKGVLLAYATPKATALIGRRLYLPEDWANDPDRREKCHVPADLVFRNSWQLALSLLDEATDVPRSWVVADDEFGRPSEFRAGLRRRNERYALDVPSNTLIRPLRLPPTPKRNRAKRLGRPRGPQWSRADKWAQNRKGGAWVRVLVRDGEKGAHYFLATSVEIETRQRREGRPPVIARERLVVIKTIGPKPQHWYVLSNAASDVSIGQIVCAWATRHGIEETIQAAKGEAGLAHYEVRSWIGWHHHITLAVLACWFLTLEHLRLGKKLLSSPCHRSPER